MPILEGSAEGADYKREHIPANTYRATLVACKAGQINDMDNPGEKKDVLFWAFEIKGKQRTVTVEGMTSFAFSGDKSKARKWVKALLGSEPPSPFDTDDLIGREARVVVVDRTSRTGEVYSGVDSVISAEEGEI